MDAQKLGRWTVEHYALVDSTNTLAKRRAREGAAHMTLILADEQTNGRGRHGRGWFSRPESGIYMSLILRPESLVCDRSPELIFPVAIALAEACGGLSGLDVQIKWPNDLVANGKKICGTLLEMGAAGNCVDFAVAGIGINVLGRDFPPDLPHAASLESLSGKMLEREALIEYFLTQFEIVYARWQEGGLAAILPAYREKSATLNKRVRVLCPEGELEGEAFDIAADGALMLRLDSGDVQTLHAGDVSVRGIMGYV